MDLDWPKNECLRNTLQSISPSKEITITLPTYLKGYIACSKCLKFKEYLQGTKENYNFISLINSL